MVTRCAAEMKLHYTNANLYDFLQSTVLETPAVQTDASADAVQAASKSHSAEEVHGDKVG